MSDLEIFTDNKRVHEYVSSLCGAGLQKEAEFMFEMHFALVRVNAALRQIEKTVMAINEAISSKGAEEIEVGDDNE